jgi:Rrf2 family protein
MKLSTRARYGTHLMIDLARRYGEGPVFLKDIANRQEISEKYLGHIIMPLKKAGLIISTRGAHGGYSLSRKPARISLLQVVEAVEGSLGLVDCVENPGICSKSHTCVSRELWEEISGNLRQTLEKVSLKDLVERKKKKDGEVLLYNI